LACAVLASSNGDIEYFYEVITNATGTRVVAYAVGRTRWDQTVTRKDLRRLSEVRHPP
jgi:hypothetical protein